MNTDDTQKPKPPPQEVSPAGFESFHSSGGGHGAAPPLQRLSPVGFESFGPSGGGK